LAYYCCFFCNMLSYLSLSSANCSQDGSAPSTIMTQSLDDNDGEECGICLDSIAPRSLRITVCCGKSICHHCAASVRVYKAVPTCPYCRFTSFSVHEIDIASDEVCRSSPALPTPSAHLEGTWDVTITETSRIGSSTYSNVVLKIDGHSACFEAEDTHFDGGRWSELTFGHTPSGQSFVARQRVKAAPSWLGDCARVSGNAGLQGRFRGLNCAEFTTSMIIHHRRSDEEMVITQKGSMMRRM